MGGFSYLHWLVIGAVALLLFGNRLPDVARSLGRSVNEFKKGLKEVKDNFDDDGDEPPKKKLTDSQQSDPIIEDKSEQHKEDPVQTAGSQQDDQ
jgi:sec-independent protein translocase protein TatA